MNIEEAIKKRHSVRQYTDRKIDEEAVKELSEHIEKCNLESGLHLQLILNDSETIYSLLPIYGKFKNANNYVAVIGEKGADLDEKCGYYGEKVVLKAMQLGINSCWIGLNYKRGKCACRIGKNEKLVCVIALGYGETNGVQHRSKPLEKLYRSDIKDIPDWFKRGVEFAALAPTAINQQQFVFCLKNGMVTVKRKSGFYSKVDLGIVKYHFEIGANYSFYHNIKK